jgi:hypothetical protein
MIKLKIDRIRTANAVVRTRWSYAIRQSATLMVLFISDFMCVTCGVHAHSPSGGLVKKPQTHDESFVQRAKTD